LYYVLRELSMYVFLLFACMYMSFMYDIWCDSIYNLILNMVYFIARGYKFES
jgi:hypothetical protein